MKRSILLVLCKHVGSTLADAGRFGLGVLLVGLRGHRAEEGDELVGSEQLAVAFIPIAGAGDRRAAGKGRVIFFLFHLRIATEKVSFTHQLHFTFLFFSSAHPGSTFILSSQEM